MKIGSVVSKICIRQIGHFILALGTHILYTSKSSSSKLKNKFHANPEENFYKIDEKLTFDLFEPHLWSKKAVDVHKQSYMVPQ